LIGKRTCSGSKIPSKKKTAARPIRQRDRSTDSCTQHEAANRARVKKKMAAQRERNQGQIPRLDTEKPDLTGVLLKKKK
jgi:hypothetical protein